jgi:hypothetical protein
VIGDFPVDVVDREAVHPPPSTADEHRCDGRSLLPVIFPFSAHFLAVLAV